MTEKLQIMYCIRMRMEVIRLILKILNGRSLKRGFDCSSCAVRTIPVSRVWTREELEKLGDICKKHGVIVVSDEIHADFVFDGKHQVFADLKPEYKDFTVICTSPGKTFNIAGLQASNILIPNEALREAFAKQITAAGYSQISAPGDRGGDRSLCTGRRMVSGNEKVCGREYHIPA